MFRYVFLANSTHEAISAAGGPFIQAFERMYFRWPHPVVKRPAGELTIERLAEDRIILGDPANLPRGNHPISKSAWNQTSRLPIFSPGHSPRGLPEIPRPFHARSHAGVARLSSRVQAVQNVQIVEERQCDRKRIRSLALCVFEGS